MLVTEKQQSASPAGQFVIPGLFDLKPCPSNVYLLKRQSQERSPACQDAFRQSQFSPGCPLPSPSWYTAPLVPHRRLEFVHAAHSTLASWPPPMVEASPSCSLLGFRCLILTPHTDPHLGQNDQKQSLVPSIRVVFFHVDTAPLCPGQRSLGEQSRFQETDSFPRFTALDSIFLQGRALSTGTAPSNRQQSSSRLFETEGNLEDHPSPPTLVTHDTSKLTEVSLTQACNSS